MKIAILSDAHGNLLFFKKCMEDIESKNVDRIIALGDYFGYMLEGQAVFDILVKHKAMLLKGNHEAMLTGELFCDPKKDMFYKLGLTKNTLSNDYLCIIRNLPEKYELNYDKKRMLFVHGCPNAPLQGYLYEDDTEKFFMQDVTGYNYIFMGHTHRPYIKMNKNVTFVNVGSCGLPRDCGLSPSFCIFDTLSGNISIVRININKELLKNSVYKNLDSFVFNSFLRREQI